jgi:hypothetical protein
MTSSLIVVAWHSKKREQELRFINNSLSICSAHIVLNFLVHFGKIERIMNEQLFNNDSRMVKF